MDIIKFNQRALRLKKENENFYRRLKLKYPKNLDEVIHKAHDEAFENIDCLKCANCCKTTSPIFYQRDIERAAKACRIKTGDFIDKYLNLDKDGDYVLKQVPCFFLDGDNYCTIYEDRPNACREYPHTDRKKMYQVLDLALKNTLVCPAVFHITEEIKKHLK